jgi:Zn-dependent protease
MLPTPQGSIRLFRLAGIDVYLHWSWFIMLFYQLGVRGPRGNLSLGWNLLLYLCLFGIVTLHEFGHAFACRQVGGRANQIILWPFGGIAFVSPPQRPGPILWSIAAGPLVNVALIPVLGGLILLTGFLGWTDANPALDRFVTYLFFLNLLILAFNLLPIYPLDGGQILQSLLWFVIGKARSLMAAVVIGFIGVALLGVVAALTRQTIFWLMVVFLLLSCWRGLMQARFLAKLAKLPRREGFACPACREPPIIGPFWICHKCLARFDAFEANAFCPNCGEHLAATACPDCGESRPMPDWRTSGFTPAPPPLPS